LAEREARKGFPRLGSFFCSLPLSLIDSLQGTINSDGLWYVEAARTFMEGGLDAAHKTFELALFPF
jgi:hypothetical protein